MPTHAGRFGRESARLTASSEFEVNRAYINLESGEVRAEFRVFPAFWPFFWKSREWYLHAGSISCGLVQINTYD
jgi:hypothetical protein